MTTLKNTYLVGLPWTRDRTVVHASTCTTHCSQETSIHAAGRIRTRNPSKQKVLGSATIGFGTWGTWQSTSLFEREELHFKRPLTLRSDVINCANSHICSKIPTGSNIWMSPRHSNDPYFIARYLARQTACSVDTSAIHMSVQIFRPLHTIVTVWHNIGYFKAQSVLFKPVRCLKHIFSLTAATLGTCNPLYTPVPQWSGCRTCQVWTAADRLSASRYLRYDSQVRKASCT
jgi:hypothetical protein